MAEANLSVERLRHLLHYDAETGIFTRKVRTGRTTHVGQIVGCHREQDGYLCVRIDGRLYLLHRLAYFYMRGRWPAHQVDHRNGIGADNRWSNLREADHEKNAQNVVAHRDNSSGLLGVTFIKATGLWHARICVARQRINLGMHQTAEQAHAAYLAAKRRLHDFQPVPRDLIDA